MRDNETTDASTAKESTPLTPSSGGAGAGGESPIQHFKSELRGMTFDQGAAMLSPVQKKAATKPPGPADFLAFEAGFEPSIVSLARAAARGGAPLPPEVQRAAEERFGPTAGVLIDAYCAWVRTLPEASEDKAGDKKDAAGALGAAKDDAAEEATSGLEGPLARWQLTPLALAGAVDLMTRAPTAVINSGRRDRAREARAWAGQMIKKQKPRWMDILLMKDLPQLVTLQQWINANWSEGEAVSDNGPRLTAKIQETLDAIDDATMAKVSPHFTGNAIDVAIGDLAYEVVASLPSGKLVNEGDHYHIGFRTADIAKGQEGG